MENFIYRILNKILIILSLLSIFGAVVYRIYNLSWPGIITSLIITAIAYFIILKLQAKFSKTHKTPDNLFSKFSFQKQWRIKNVIYAIVYILTVIICFFTLFSGQTNVAIVSPWQVVPNCFFIIFLLASLLLSLIIIKNNPFSLLLLSIHYFLSFSIALVVYRLGFGFDSFVHNATLELISETGIVEPKPFYYLGYYSLIVIIHKISFISLTLLNKILVPALAAIFLPVTLYQALQNYFNNKKRIKLLILALLLLPFSVFIISVPQNLAFLFLLLAVLLGLGCKNLFNLVLIYLLSLAALAIHPVAGIPAVFYSLFLTIYHCDRDKLKKYFYFIVFIFSSIALPLAFFLAHKLSPVLTHNNYYKEQGIELFSWFNFFISNQENFILNFLYLYIFNIKFLFFALISFGAITTFLHRKKCKIFFVYFLAAVSILVSCFFTKFLPFNFLITYERSNFTDRILLASIICFLPFAIIAIYALFDKIFKQNYFIKISFLLFLTLLITASVYNSYPRFDHFHNSHGYSVGKNDIEAVRWIDSDAPADYIVLANQQVSAAALREFGFKKYFKIAPSPYRGEGGGEVFYYPIPTGGPLYQYYLEMVYEQPSRETIIKAMNMMGVDQAYFVLNKYWWAFQKILAEAQLAADAWQEIGDGEIYIFKYHK